MENRMRLQPPVASAIFAAILFGSARPASPCSCENNLERFSEAVRLATAVFEGVAVHVTSLPPRGDFPELAIHTQFAVVRVWKGPHVPALSVLSDGVCSGMFVEGNNYIVYAYPAAKRVKGTRLWVEKCTRTHGGWLEPEEALLGTPRWVGRLDRRP
jgi:hypothetical protein